MRVIALSTKIVECLRIAQLIERHGDLFLNRVFTPAEVRFCSFRGNATQHYTSYWAGKEAVVDLLGGYHGGFRWKDIEIRREQTGVRVALAGNARLICESAQIVEVRLAIAFCRTHATAYGIALGFDDDEL